MEMVFRHYRALFSNTAFVRSVLQGAAFLAASMIAIFAAVAYATANASNHVTDMVLSSVGPMNVRSFSSMAPSLNSLSSRRFFYGGPTACRSR